MILQLIVFLIGVLVGAGLARWRFIGQIERLEERLLKEELKKIKRKTPKKKK